MRAREVSMRSASASAMAEQVASPATLFMVQNLTKCLGSTAKQGKQDRGTDAAELRVEEHTRAHHDPDSTPTSSASDGDVLCWETANGAKWQYLRRRDAKAGKKWIQMVNLQPQQNFLAVRKTLSVPGTCLSPVLSMDGSERHGRLPRCTACHLTSMSVKLFRINCTI